MTTTDLGLAPGTCDIQWQTDHAGRTGRLLVLHADPKVYIGAELMDLIRAGKHHPDVSLRDDVLTIDAANRRVVYRIGEYLAMPDCFLAEWPD